MTDLNLALIGNSSIAALVDANAEIVWGCFPRFDSDALFCSLLRGQRKPDDAGFWAIDLLDSVRSEQAYVTNTPVLATRLYARDGSAVEITDFAPRFRQYGRMFCPMMIVRRVRRLAGSPRIRMRVRPAHSWGAQRAALTYGSNHIRFVTPDVVLRLTTDVSITALLQETPFFLEDQVTLLLGPDETVQDAVEAVGHRFEVETLAYWRERVRYLAIPFEWQEAVIRAAISLKLNAFDDTGAIIAAVTTSIPEAADSGRNWDYRYCWLRDAYFVVNALNRLSATRTMERYLSYIINVSAGAPNGRLQPVYRIDGIAHLDEHEVPSLAGYRGMGPVRVGNQAYLQVQNDVYGSAVLAATHVFFDRRLYRPGNEELFQRLERVGEIAYRVYAQPDAGLWELRGKPRVHTFSSVMCWVACDRLARIAVQLGLADRSAQWRTRADEMHRVICQRAWSERRRSFVATFEGESLDASLLLLPELRFLPAQDPRFSATVAQVERELKQGDFVFRYSEPDDFGAPHNAFVVCTFWYIDALAALGRKDEARALFQTMLDCRNAHGLLAEHIDPRTRELWGNFVQTYSMVGLINSAVRLSVPWEEAF
ncbi:MAG TPA: glycoside hydrolase family 15 protein [Burkholderiales bacterium]|nr:glycoside hydrolase family 15 protein [Burkholderiales bacterium]